jgi:hypothetical protein
MVTMIIYTFGRTRYKCAMNYYGQKRVFLMYTVERLQIQDQKNPSLVLLALIRLNEPALNPTNVDGESHLGLM